MKKLLMIMLSTLSLVAYAQKIALIEPRAGEGATTITGMEKAMVRGELRKAIVNHTGFEAFTRADIDQLMKEQDFQRTGNVSEADIHRMGEMSGADYLCISTLNKSDNEFYLEAYLINVETGAISNPASQYGELVNGKLANMLPVCQALAQELLGTTTPIAQPVITKPAPTPKQEEIKSQNSALDVNTQDKQSNLGSNSLGGLKCFPDGSKGIIFYIDKGGHGLVVSLDEAKLKWENENSQYKCHDILELPNDISENFAQRFAYQLGLSNTDKIIRQIGSQASAAVWCAQHGEGWYLPSAGELVYLFGEANSQNGIQGAWARTSVVTNGTINRGIKQAGGTSLSDEEYWSSTEIDKDDVHTVTGSGRLTSSEKQDVRYVRAVKAF